MTIDRLIEEMRKKKFRDLLVEGYSNLCDECLKRYPDCGGNPNIIQAHPNFDQFASEIPKERYNLVYTCGSYQSAILAMINDMELFCKEFRLDIKTEELSTISLKLIINPKHGSWINPGKTIDVLRDLMVAQNILKGPYTITIKQMEKEEDGEEG